MPALMVALTAYGCTGLDARIRQHKEKLESLGATTARLGEAWLAGTVSGTYTSTALDRTFRLVELERTGLAASPQALVDPKGARLSQEAERLSRLLAVLIEDVRRGDGPSARRHLTGIPIPPAEAP